MIVLDTNVLSELMRPAPAPRVVDWLDAQDAREVATTAITVAEILYGIERLPDGRRKQRLAELAAVVFETHFKPERILAFDARTAIHYAGQVATGERAGRTVPMADAQIAAICIEHQAVLATRNVRDFESLDVALANPWDAVP